MTPDPTSDRLVAAEATIDRQRDGINALREAYNRSETSLVAAEATITELRRELDQRQANEKSWMLDVDRLATRLTAANQRIADLEGALERYKADEQGRMDRHIAKLSAHAKTLSTEEKT